jgi:hypothetical protein
MSTTADNSWDVHDSFSLHHGSRKASSALESRANVLGTNSRLAPPTPQQEKRFEAADDFAEKFDSVSVDHAAESEEDARYNRAISMWLKWSAAYEEVSGRMFKEGEDTAKLEALLDEMDQLRLEAVELSEGLLNY